MSWIAVYVGTGKEDEAIKKIKLSISRAGRKLMEIFTPEKTIDVPAKKDVVFEKLLPGYVFVDCCQGLDNQLWHLIRDAFGIYNNSNGAYQILPGIVTNEEIQKMKSLSHELVEHACPEDEMTTIRALQAKFKDLVVKRRNKRSFIRIPQNAAKSLLKKIQTELGELNHTPKNKKRSLFLENLCLAL